MKEKLSILHAMLTCMEYLKNNNESEIFKNLFKNDYETSYVYVTLECEKVLNEQYYPN